MENLIKELREARKKKGMTQSRLAHSVGLPQSHISGIEQGKIDIRISTLMQIARILDHEVILTPRQMEPYIKALIAGKEDVETQPRFQVDPEDS